MGREHTPQQAPPTPPVPEWFAAAIAHEMMMSPRYCDHVWQAAWDELIKRGSVTEGERLGELVRIYVLELDDIPNEAVVSRADRHETNT
jgi:hypothetical protein